MTTTYVVTGSSSGLGYALTDRLLQCGHRVIGVSRSEKRGSDFKTNSNFRHIACDFSEEIDHSIFQIVPEGNVILILNAAQFEFEDTGSVTIKRAKELFAINYFSAVELVNYFKSRGLCRVVFINSIAGREPQDHQFQYSSSKHALQAFSEILAKESVGKSFDVMSFNPGGLNTELWEHHRILDSNITDQFLAPTVLAEFICSAVALPLKTYIKSAIILPEHDV